MKILELIKKLINKLFKQNSYKLQEVDSSFIRDELLKQIEDDSQKFKNQAVNYYITEMLIGNSDFNVKNVEKIYQQYPKEFQKPFFDTSNYNLYGEKLEIFNKIIEEKIKNYPQKENYLSKKAYEYMLLDEAKKEAEKILDSYK